MCQLLSRFLEQKEMLCHCAHDSREIFNQLKDNEFDLLLLDIMLPGLSGLEILQKIRQTSNIPVIMLTARGDVRDRVSGLNLGADDYIPKPFDPAEVAARIRALLRRQNGYHYSGKMFADFIYNHEKMRLTKSGEDIALTRLEFELLEIFLNSKGRLITRNHITESLKDDAFEIFNRSADILVSRLRRKLKDNPREPHLIRTVHGSGYIFISKVKPC